MLSRSQMIVLETIAQNESKYNATTRTAIAKACRASIGSLTVFGVIVSLRSEGYIDLRRDNTFTTTRRGLDALKGAR